MGNSKARRFELFIHCAVHQKITVAPGLTRGLVALDVHHRFILRKAKASASLTQATLPIYAT
jgi:hypothetical protein